MCGKKGDKRLKNASSDGSLPRVWEKAILQVGKKGNTRITPTCVGKRLSICGQNEHFEFILS